MAQYTITHACGHDQTHVLYGKIDKRMQTLSGREQGECTACYRADQARQAAKIATKYDLPALVGTEKQVAWAETLRGDRIREIRRHVEKAINPAEFSEMPITWQRVCDNSVAALVGMMRDRDSAAWWIDGRHDRVEPFLATILGEPFDAAGKKSAEWWRGMLSRGGQTLTPQDALLIWYDVRAVLEYALPEPESDLIASALAALLEALSTGPEIAPLPGDVRLVPVATAHGRAKMIPLTRPVRLARMLSALADLTTDLPGCDAEAVRTAAGSLAVALRIEQVQPA